MAGGGFLRLSGSFGMSTLLAGVRPGTRRSGSFGYFDHATARPAAGTRAAGLADTMMVADPPGFLQLSGSSGMLTSGRM
jgi:hypothetical protein